MLEAIRNLGILKMIREFSNVFTCESFESADKFLEQRKKAIKEGMYGKLQFESIKDKDIGVFFIGNGEINFKKMSKIDDTSEYIFRKTPGSQAAYISPTWKASQDDEDKKENKRDKKLKSTVKEFKSYADSKGLSKDTKEIFLKLCKVFESNAIQVEDKGKIIKKDFWGIYHEKKKCKKNKRGLNVFTIAINGLYPGKIQGIRNYALNRIGDEFYTTSGVTSSSGKCSICHHEGMLFSNVLSGVGINIANIDKPVFFPGVSKEHSGKAFPICSPCAEALFVAKTQVFPKFTQSISGHQALIIPHLIQSEDKEEGLEIMGYALKLLKDDIGSAKGTEAGIIEDLSDNKGVATISFLFGEVKGQTVGGKKGIRKFLPDVLPSKLSKIARAIHEVNNIHDCYPQAHPWKLKWKPLDGKLQIIRNVLGMAKYDVKPQQGKRKPFKASSMDSLDLLEAIFMQKSFSLKVLLPEFSAKLSYDFVGSFSDEKQESSYEIRNIIAQMVYLLKFLDKLGVIKMTENKNLVSKYLEGCEGLEPLNKFLTEEAIGLDNAEKQYIFLVGLLFGKLIAFQQAKKVANNALRWLKGLEIGHQDLMEIFIKTRSKLDDYSFQRPAWSGEMKGVAEALGSLGAQIGSKWSISRKDIPYYFCLGQSLSGYYLPSKEKESENK